MLRKIGISLALVTAATAIGLYIVNPSNTASSDPRARILGFATYRIPAKSMVPTLRPGDYIVAGTYAYWKSDPAFGDVITFRYPRDPDQNYVKRVVGLPGDTIRMAGTQVWRNGELIHEPYVQYLSASQARRGGRWLVPDGHYFVLGDNRDTSADSRFWGFLPRSHIIAKVKYVWLSDQDNAGPVKHGK